MLIMKVSYEEKCGGNLFNVSRRAKERERYSNNCEMLSEINGINPDLSSPGAMKHPRPFMILYTTQAVIQPDKTSLTSPWISVPLHKLL